VPTATREREATSGGGYSLRGADRPKRGGGGASEREREKEGRNERNQREREREKEKERERESERDSDREGLSAAANSALIKTRAGSKKFREQPMVRVIQEEEVTAKDVALFFTDIKGHLDGLGEDGRRKWKDFIKGMDVVAIFVPFANVLVLEMYNLGITGSNETAAITYSLMGTCLIHFYFLISLVRRLRCFFQVFGLFINSGGEV
jgi:hypothetical protein